MSDGDTYIEAIEKFKAFAESQKRSEGSPMQGEKSDRFGEKRINELMKFASGAGDLSKQFDRDEGVAQFTMEDYVRLEGPNYTPEAELKLIQSFGTQDEIETMITIVKRMQDPNERDEQQYEEDSKIRRALVNKYFDRIGGMDNYFKTHDRLNREFEMNEVYGTKFDPRMRNEGSPMQGEQMNVENVGIMDGFSGDGSEAEAMAIVEEGERAKNEIDGTSTYDELMQSIRGDNLTEADRRQELASYVGEKDAEETPDSVLTLVQPVMQMLDEGTANTGIGQIEEGREMATIAPTQQDAEEMMAMNMPQQPVGVANGGYMSSFPNQNLNTESLSASDNIDDRIMQNLQFERMAPGMMGYANGGQVQHFASGDLAEIQNTYNAKDYLFIWILLIILKDQKVIH